MNHLKIGALLLVLTTFATVIEAEPLWYVNDYLIINMRAGPSDDAKTLNTLPTGSAVEVLDERDDYFRVRDKDGVKGWVLKQYLIAKPVARIVLKQTQDDLGKLESDYKLVSQRYQKLKDNNNKLNTQFNTLENESARLNKENERFKVVAARPIEIANENKMLLADLETLKSEAVSLHKTTKVLKEGSAQRWFMAGSGALLFGIVLGLFLPRLRYRSDESGWS